MPPTAALLLTAVLVCFLFYRELKTSRATDWALWLPVLWLTVTGSRFVSQWLNLGVYGSSADSMAEGSAIDALYFMALILAGLAALAQRRLVIGELVRRNRWLFAFLLYGLLSILWSDFPFIAFKRWIKTLGHPLMALLILTHPDPLAALGTVMKRCAYSLLPFSVLFIKYYPQYGRSFDAWSGAPVNHGVMLTKNDLGYVCMMLGLFFFWNLLRARQSGERSLWEESALSGGFLVMIVWLLTMADSATSFFTFMLGVLVLVLLRLPVVNKRFIGTYVIVGLLMLAGAEAAFGIYAQLLALLERDPTLTDRTLLWADVIALQDRTLWGSGFESFWLGPRLELLWAKWWWQPNQAHNGYIETYLNLGAVGVALLAAVIIAVFRNISRELATNFVFAQWRLALLFAVLLFNFTEAAFKGVHFVWTIFYLVAIDYPRVAPLPTAVRLSALAKRLQAYQCHYPAIAKEKRKKHRGGLWSLDR